MAPPLQLFLNQLFLGRSEPLGHPEPLHIVKTETGKNEGEPDARSHAARQVCEQHSDTGNAADGRFSAFLLGAAGELAHIP